MIPENSKRPCLRWLGFWTEVERERERLKGTRGGGGEARTEVTTLGIVRGKDGTQVERSREKDSRLKLV